MKNLLLVAVTVLAAQFSFAEVPAEREVQVGISGAFIPGGFDSASDAYVIVNGVFQNGCYKWKRADINSKDGFTHEIRSIAAVTQGMCIMVLIPFQKDVPLANYSLASTHLDS